jgi:hypothetical protein
MFPCILKYFVRSGVKLLSEAKRVYIVFEIGAEKRHNLRKEWNSVTRFGI